MVRVIGTDPGTRSFDLCGLENEKVFLDESIPADIISKNPKIIVDRIKSCGKIDLVVGPSGYGLPLTRLDKIRDEDILLATLFRSDERGRLSIMGLRKVLQAMREEALPVYLIPGVIHLPTVSERRKINRIDMGTADKICCAALGIYDQANRLGIECESTSFFLIELGYSYSSVIAVESGKIVDGVGGTGLVSPLGFRSLGAMDGELAYLLGIFSKTTLFSGGVASIVGDDKIAPEDFAARIDEDEKYTFAFEVFEESIIKTVTSLTSSVKKPKEILLSGRLSRIREIFDRFFLSLSYIAPARRVQGLGATKAKEASQGSALIADGLAGGRFKRLVDGLEIREAKGTVFDHIYLKGIKEIRHSFGLS